MKNIIVIPSYHTGTSLDEMLQSIQLLIQENKWPIEIIGADLRVNDKSGNDLFDTEEEVSGYNTLLKRLYERKDVERILFLDFFFPGIDMYKYFMEVTCIKPKLGAFMLGGTFLSGDLYQWDWLKEAEKLWFTIFDTLYVPSKYFFDSVPLNVQNKVQISPWGIDHSLQIINTVKRENISKEYDVIFPHRLDKDKGVDEFIQIVESMPEVNFYISVYAPSEDNSYFKKLKGFPNVHFLTGEDDVEHLRSLHKSKIVLSCAKQETHGYSMIKAVLSGAIPLVPNREVYPELYPQEFIYKDVEDTIKKIRAILKDTNPMDFEDLQNKFEGYSFKSLLSDFFELS